jgi:hypothetical protein
MDKNNIPTKLLPPNFPELLTLIKNPPQELYCLGNIPKGFYIALVGTRRPGNYSKELCKRLVKSLQNTQAIVVSGLAQGIDCYDFDEEMAKNMSGARYKVFKSYDMDWLNYVIDCRRGGELQLQYDVVEGGVANDNVIDTVEDYENGIITAEQALGQLVYKKVNHQICIRSQKVVDACLKFTGSEIL